MKLKPAGLLALLLAAVCALGSCSLFDGKRKRKPLLFGPSTLPSGSPTLGGEGINLGGLPDQSGN